MLAAINIKFRQARPDLRHATDEEIRDERLAFITDALHFKRPLASMRNLTDRQLGLVLDALRRLETQPALPNSEATPAPKPENTGGAKVIHLASAEQVHTINKLLDHLNWDLDVRADFIRKRYKRNVPTMLTPKDANSCIMVLLTIAASRAVRSRGVSRVSRLMIRQEIPDLKARLGIDRKEG
jgi:hypothetical protein